MHTNTKKSEFVNLQAVLIDLKKTPESLEIPVPRFLKRCDEDRLNKRDAMVLEMRKALKKKLDPEVETYEVLVPKIQGMEDAIMYIQKIERGR